MAHGMKPGSGGFSDNRLWLSVGVGVAAGAGIAYQWPLSYFSGGFLMSALGYVVFMIGGAVLGMIVGSLLLRPDAGH